MELFTSDSSYQTPQRSWTCNFLSLMSNENVSCAVEIYLATKLQTLLQHELTCLKWTGLFFLITLSGGRFTNRQQTLFMTKVVQQNNQTGEPSFWMHLVGEDRAEIYTIYSIRWTDFFNTNSIQTFIINWNNKWLIFISIFPLSLCFSHYLIQLKKHL